MAKRKAGRPPAGPGGRKVSDLPVISLRVTPERKALKKIMDFGAFIEIKPGQEGLCHISELDEKRVGKVQDILNEGDEVIVKVLDIDRQGKVKLSRKAAFGKKPTH